MMMRDAHGCGAIALDPTREQSPAEGGKKASRKGALLTPPEVERAISTSPIPPFLSLSLFLFPLFKERERERRKDFLR